MTKKKGIWQRIKGFFSRGKSKGRNDDGVLYYMLRQKPVGGHWQDLQKVEKEMFEEIRRPEDLQVPDDEKNRFYKLVEIVNDNGKHGETIWEREPRGIGPTTDAEQMTKIIQEAVRQEMKEKGGSGDNNLDAIHEAFMSLREEAEKMEEIADGAEKISNMFGNKKQADSGVEYEGTLPAFMSPEARNFFVDLADEVGDNIAKSFSKAGKKEEEDELDDSFEEALEE